MYCVTTAVANCSTSTFSQCTEIIISLKLFAHTHGIQSTVVVVLLVGSVFLTGVLTSSGDGGTQTDSTSTEHDDVNAQGIEETIADLFNNSRSKFLAALTNLSSYLPLNVKYAMTDGQKCDIIKYNRPYYSNIPLILAAVVIVLGAIFTFFGEHPSYIFPMF